MLVYLTAKRISATDTPATATCKEKLLIALHNSLLIILLDIWERNILVFDEEWVGRPILPDHSRFGKERLMFPILKCHCQLHQYVYLEIRSIHGMKIYDLGICASYREMVEFL